MDRKMSKANSLALLGDYVSETESECSEKSDEGDREPQNEDVEWIECFDEKTNHSYFWNIKTKSVTWEKPENFQTLKKVQHKLSISPSDERKEEINDDLQNSQAEKKFENNVQEVDVFLSSGQDACPEDADSHSEEENVMDSKNCKFVGENSFAAIITGGKVECNKHEKELLEACKAADDTFDKKKETEEDCPSPVLTDGKTFKRKRRLEFNVQRFIRKKDSSLEKSDVTSPVTNKFINFQEGEIFLGSQNDSNIMGSSNGEHKPVNENSTIDDVFKPENSRHLPEIDDFFGLINEKLKFLLVGSDNISSIQIMDCQIKTLYSAYKAGQLNEEYFLSWLKLKSNELSELEKNAAPEGWATQWDRELLRYVYKNIATSDIVLEYPQDKDEDETSEKDKQDCQQDSESEMDISMTPPPPDISKIDDVWTQPPPPPIISYQPPPPGTDEEQKAVNSSIEMNDAIASFYSDIASMEGPKVISTSEDQSIKSVTSLQTKNKHLENELIHKKKRRKNLQNADTELKSMVATWQKAQQELEE